MMGNPASPRLCQRMLHGHDDVPIMFIAFDVLEAHDESTLRLPYRRRRLILEALELHGDYWSTGSSDPAAGVVAGVPALLYSHRGWISISTDLSVYVVGLIIGSISDI